MNDEQLYRAVSDNAASGPNKTEALLSRRLDFVESKRSDPKGYERLIGDSDLLSLNFLDRGRRAADAVCRISLPVEGGFAYGTGCLVGPRLLITNNHVLATPAEAAQADAEFAYQHDLDGVVGDPVTFNLDPQSLFFTSSELDITLVAVVARSERGVPIERFGWLPLIAQRQDGGRRMGNRDRASGRTAQADCDPRQPDHAPDA